MVWLALWLEVWPFKQWNQILHPTLLGWCNAWPKCPKYGNRRRRWRCLELISTPTSCVFIVFEVFLCEHPTTKIITHPKKKVRETNSTEKQIPLNISLALPDCRDQEICGDFPLTTLWFWGFERLLNLSSFSRKIHEHPWRPLSLPQYRRVVNTVDGSVTSWCGK